MSVLILDHLETIPATCVRVNVEIIVSRRRKDEERRGEERSDGWM